MLSSIRYQKHAWTKFFRENTSLLFCNLAFAIYIFIRRSVGCRANTILQHCNILLILAKRQFHLFHICISLAFSFYFPSERLLLAIALKKERKKGKTNIPKCSFLLLGYAHLYTQKVLSSFQFVCYLFLFGFFHVFLRLLENADAFR